MRPAEPDQHSVPLLGQSSAFKSSIAHRITLVRGALIAGACFVAVAALILVTGVRHASLQSGKQKLPGVAYEEQAGGPIWFQAHSYNDLRQWESLYLKGARSFKIDPHFVRGDGTFRNRTRIIFTHNLPLPTYRIRYDTFEDLLHELGPNGPTGMRLKHDKSKIRIQLCFKSAPILICNSTKSHRPREQHAWLALIDDFYDRVNESPFIEEHVEFLLDGGGKPSGCLRNRWRKWKSVWIQGDSQSPSSALTTAEPNKDAENARFVVLNNAAGLSNWQKIASVSFGRFKELPYPYQIWEPDDQLSIMQHVEVFLQAKPYHPAGLTMVSNSDPAMIALYAGATGTLNRPILQGSNLNCPIGVYANANSLLVVLYTSSGKLKSSTFTKQFGFDATLLSTEDVEGPSEKGPQWTRFDAEVGGLSTLTNDNGLFRRLWIRPWDGRLMTIKPDLRAPLPFGTESLAERRCIVVKRLRSNTQMVALWLFTHKPSDSGQPQCILGTSLFDVPINSKSVTMISGGCLLYQSRGKQPPADADLVELSATRFGVVYSDTNKQVYGGLWDASTNVTTPPDFRSLTVGSNPRFTGYGEAVALFLTDSICSNNMDLNRRAGPVALCDLPYVSSRGVMTYSVGTPVAWLDTFRHGHLIRSCDADILHGAFDVGACPVPFMTLKKKHRKTKHDDAYDELEMASIHRTIDDLKPNEKGCGVPRWTSSIILNKLPVFVTTRNTLLLSSDDGDQERSNRDVHLLAR